MFSEGKDSVKSVSAGAHVKEASGTAGCCEKNTGFSCRIPVYLCALLMIAAFLLGVVSSYRLFPSLSGCTSTDSNNSLSSLCGQSGADSKSVGVTILYSADCKICSESHSVLDVLNDRAIPYSADRIEVSSAEGKKLVAKYNVTEVPTALVDYEKMSLYPATQKGFSEKFPRILGKFVARETNLNTAANYPVMFLGTGDCNAGKGKIPVVLFDDFYHKISLLGRNSVNAVLEKFGSKLDFDYVYLPVGGNLAGEDKELKQYKTAEYLECAQRQGKYLEFENNVRAIVCNFDGNADNFSEQDSFVCNGSQSLNILDEDGLSIAAEKSGLDMNTLSVCLAGSEGFYPEWEKVIRDHGVEKRRVQVGLALVGCSYLAEVTKLNTALCSVDSSLEGCTV